MSTHVDTRYYRVKLTEPRSSFLAISKCLLFFLLQNSGIEKILPGSINDGCLFNPIGFSLNGLYKDSYYTIHVTPQPSCSYVSFETNIKKENYDHIVNKVLDIFKPNKFIITLFSTKVSGGSSVMFYLRALSIVNF